MVNVEQDVATAEMMSFLVIQKVSFACKRGSEYHGVWFLGVHGCC